MNRRLALDEKLTKIDEDGKGLLTRSQDDQALTRSIDFGRITRYLNESVYKSMFHPVHERTNQGEESVPGDLHRERTCVLCKLKAASRERKSTYRGAKVNQSQSSVSSLLTRSSFNFLPLTHQIAQLFCPFTVFVLLTPHDRRASRIAIAHHDFLRRRFQESWSEPKVAASISLLAFAAKQRPFPISAAPGRLLPK